MVWAVLAPTNNPGPGSLAGTYVGATGSASIGVGVGADVLFGGFGNSISLQPLSVHGTGCQRRRWHRRNDADF